MSCPSTGPRRIEVNSKLYKQIVDSALVDLPHIVETSNPEELNEIADKLDHTAVRLVRMAAYLQSRIYNGMSHQQAVRYQNSRAAKVRRALGYTYPRQDINF